jgi:hypothetical protein
MSILINPSKIHTDGYLDEEKASKTIYMSGVYLHGEVERLAGYDLCGIVDKNPNELIDGVYECQVLGVPDSPATMFFWIDKSRGNKRGLIVFNSDTTHYKDASAKYNKREPHL